MADFENKVVLVTGAGRGIGREIALAFARHGAILAVNDITPVNLDETVRQIRSAGAQVKDYINDVAKKMPVQEMVDEVLLDWRRVDILINNAGVHPLAPLLDMDEWDLRRTMDVNLLGPFFTMQQVGRAMHAQGGGAIVNIAAALGRAQAMKDSAAFVASKMGLIGLTRAAARELAPGHIRVNAVCPGWIETEATQPSSKIYPQVQEWSASIPMDRLGRPEEVADLVLYLCSDAASYITGQAIDLDGGMVMA